MREIVKVQTLGGLMNVKRIQRKGYYDWSWSKNPNAVAVHRPTKWGNPYRLSEYSLDECLRLYEIWLREKLKVNPDFLKPLVGKDLVCYCSPYRSCHADILIKYVKEIYGA